MSVCTPNTVLVLFTIVSRVFLIGSVCNRVLDISIILLLRHEKNKGNNDREDECRPKIKKIKTLVKNMSPSHKKV